MSPCAQASSTGEDLHLIATPLVTLLLAPTTTVRTTRPRTLSPSLPRRCRSSTPPLNPSPLRPPTFASTLQPQLQLPILPLLPLTSNNPSPTSLKLAAIACPSLPTNPTATTRALVTTSTTIPARRALTLRFPVTPSPPPRRGGLSVAWPTRSLPFTSPAPAMERAASLQACRRREDTLTLCPVGLACLGRGAGAVPTRRARRRRGGRARASRCRLGDREGADGWLRRWRALSVGCCRCTGDDRRRRR